MFMFPMKFQTLLFWLLAPLFLISCIQEKTTPVSVQPGPDILRVGMTTNAPPVAYRKDGKITGLEVDFAEGLARFSGRKLHIVEMKWEDLIPALLDKKIDIIMSSMTITPARQYRIAFSTPYMISGQVMLVRRPELARYANGFSDLLNPAVRIGTVKATTGDLLIREKINRGNCFSFQNPVQGVRALIDNKIDVFVYDLPMNFYFAAENEINGLAPVIIPLTREQIAWGMRKDDIKLRQTANAYLTELKTNGQLKDKLIHWIPFFKNVFNR
jgi:polar amino acid transport system substrate-binding protein